MSAGSNNKRRPPPEPSQPLNYSWQMEYSDVVYVFPHEELSLYVEGGFHPVAIGDTFCQGRYRIHHKLGFGGYATVWLARDEHDDKWVSIKIKQAYVSTDDIDQDSEIKSYRRIEQHYATKEEDVPDCFVQLLDCFQHTGPNGTHTCLVMELTGPSLKVVIQMYREMEENLRPDTIIRSSLQLLHTIADSHEAGVVHGDISPSNVAFTCNAALNDEVEFWNTVGEAKVAEYGLDGPRPPNLPKHLVRSTIWPGWYDDPQEDIRVLDWGESFPVGEVRRYGVIAQPGDLISPESFFIGSVGYQHDFWRAGCVIYALFYARMPLGGFHPDYRYIQVLVHLIGPLPESWNAKWLEMKEKTEQEYDAKEAAGHHVYRRPPFDPNKGDGIYKSLDVTFEPRRTKIIEEAKAGDYYRVGKWSIDDFEGLKGLFDAIKGLMQIDPDKRMSAEDAIQGIQWRDHWRFDFPMPEDEDCDEEYLTGNKMYDSSSTSDLAEKLDNVSLTSGEERTGGRRRCC